MFDLKNNEKTFNVRPVGVKYICEFCKEGEMVQDKDNKEVLMSYPSQFPHKCNKCNKTMYLPKPYPYIEWVTKND